MPYDAGLAFRLEELLGGRPGFVEKKMFGGIGWMLDGNMCVGVYREWLIIRTGEAAFEKLLKEKHVKPMDITGRPMKGWVMVAPAGVGEDKSLKRYVEMATKFVKTLPAKN